MDLFSDLKPELRSKVVSHWSGMSESDRMHFINQLSLGLSIWGSDDPGKSIALEVLENMLEDGSSNLSDFGIYLDGLLSSKGLSGRVDKVKRASLIIDGYRLKNSLSSEPHKNIGI